MARQNTISPKGAAAALLLPATVLVFVGLAIPMITMLRYSFNEYDPALLMRDAFTFENYRRFFTEPYFLTVLLNTVKVAFVSTVAALALSFPVAYFLARTQSRAKSLLVVLVVFPLLVGNVVRSAGWIALFGSAGLINVTLQAVGLISRPLVLINTDTAVIIGTVSVVMPLMILSLQSVFEGIDFSLVDAALNLGATKMQAFRRVFLPIVAQGISSSFVLVFILSMNAYATPYLLGGPGYKMMAPVLYNQITSASNWPFGSALAFILMLFTAIAIIPVTLARKMNRQF